MKLILSRKGFDSACGRCASPILQDGTLLSLPIREARAPIRFGDIRDERGTRLASLVSDLTRGEVTAGDRAHLDPDLRPGALPREPGWRPMFGQTEAAQRHLANHGVGPGDLFLYFGWFREVQQREGRTRYVPHAPDLHVLFGWLRVGDVWSGDALRRVPPWARSHAHVAADYGPTSTVYVAAEGRDGAPDAGAFPRLVDDLVLTARGSSRRLWKLPAWFHPEGRATSLSYHGNPARWHRAGSDHVLLTTVGRGQEFVLDTTDYPEAVPWARELIAAGTREATLARAG